MMRTKTAWMGLLLAGTLLAGCFSGSSDDANSPAKEVVIGNDLQPDGGAPQSGGTFFTTITTEAPTLDPHKAASAYTQVAVSGSVYSKLLEFKSGRGVPYGTSETEGDLAETYESSADGLTWTFKLRKGVKFQNIAPVSGREFTSADVVCTMDRIRSLPGVQNNLLGVVNNWTPPGQVHRGVQAQGGLRGLQRDDGPLLHGDHAVRGHQRSVRLGDPGHRHRPVHADHMGTQGAEGLHKAP